MSIGETYHRSLGIVRVVQLRGPVRLRGPLLNRRSWNASAGVKTRCMGGCTGQGLPSCIVIQLWFLVIVPAVGGNNRPNTPEELLNIVGKGNVEPKNMAQLPSKSGSEVLVRWFCRPWRITRDWGQRAQKSRIPQSLGNPALLIILAVQIRQPPVHAIVQFSCIKSWILHLAVLDLRIPMKIARRFQTYLWPVKQGLTDRQSVRVTQIETNIECKRK